MNNSTVKILVLSDLHFEYSGVKSLHLPDEDMYDLVVLAGDIDLKCRGIKWAKDNFKKPSIYVPGNHEFWGRNLQNEDKYMRQEASGSQVNYLNMDEIVINGIRFLGATCWTDFGAWDDVNFAMQSAEAGKNKYSAGCRDYAKITSVGYRKLRAYETASMATKTKNWLKQKLSEDFDGKTIIVTHHAPIIQSLKQGVLTDVLDAADVNNWEDFIIETNANVWIHGHTHKNMDLIIGNTRVVSNASGGNGLAKDGEIYHYNSSFSNSFIIEV